MRQYWKDRTHHSASDLVMYFVAQATTKKDPMAYLIYKLTSAFTPISKDNANKIASHSCDPFYNRNKAIRYACGWAKSLSREIFPFLTDNQYAQIEEWANAADLMKKL